MAHGEAMVHLRGCQLIKAITISSLSLSPCFLGGFIFCLSAWHMCVCARVCACVPRRLGTYKEKKKAGRCGQNWQRAKERLKITQMPFASNMQGWILCKRQRLMRQSWKMNSFTSHMPSIAMCITAAHARCKTTKNWEKTSTTEQKKLKIFRCTVNTSSTSMHVQHRFKSNMHDPLKSHTCHEGEHT